MASTWALSPGSRIRRTDLHEQYGGRRLLEAAIRERRDRSMSLNASVWAGMALPPARQAHGDLLAGRARAVWRRLQGN